ncbi:thiamine pyrophosphate-binding protein [Saccharopolyspora sp. K220]|uniref:thiamine pyrophosphate-binding protein n=1 Tax=Saccharopolyspora soli TaxID=2926618 RepID=UPI001F595CCB|nr:thiamine pyrophosphate-binding protein [Saccharopolyspora soli]MCI2418291.1 thiamine pyrophosphate-binding protein [Saccharopolyspora soli]
MTGTFAGRGADLLVECLVRAGISRLFGVPGDTGVVFYDALHQRSNDIHHVLARDERHAAAMADGYARATNVVGTVEVSSGGGTTYVVGGLGETYASAVPVLLITSDIHRRSRGTGALTEIDQEALFSAVTKWRATVDDPRRIPEFVARALTEITAGRPAPAALILPEDVLDETVTVPVEVFDQLAGASAVPRTRPAAPEGDIARAADLLARAESPAILAGSGVHLSGAWANLRRLSDKAAIPVATTIHGKGVIADDSPLSIGTAGNNGGLDEVNAQLAEADVVLLVGTRANATDTNGFTAPSRDATIVAIDIERDLAGRNYPGSLVLAGDADRVLGQLADRIPEIPQRSARHRRADRPAPAAGELPDGQLLPAEVIHLVQDVLGDRATVVADPGTPTPHVAVSWRTAEAGRDVIVPRGHGPMGYAIPAAIGVAFARPDRPVLALTADGSFAMACGELETVARYRLPIVFVQFTNHSLGWIKMLQHLYTGRRYFGVDPGTADAAAIAEASGIRGVRARSLADVAEAVRKAVDSREPVYLDVEVPHMIDHTPPVPAWTRALAGDAERPVY